MIIDIGNESDFQATKGVSVEVKGLKYKIAIFNVNGQFYAVKDPCPHAGHPLSNGHIIQNVLSCPGHNWQFNLETGKCIKGDKEIVLKMFEIRSENGKLLLVV